MEHLHQNQSNMEPTFQNQGNVEPTNQNQGNMEPTIQYQGNVEPSNQKPVTMEKKWYSALDDYAPIFGDFEVREFKCPSCKETVNTSIVLEKGTFFKASMVIFTVILCPLFWMPLVMDCFKDKAHYCPACGVKLGTFVR